MKINRNMSAVMTNTQLLRTENKLTASMERLSSGYKINRAGDNPAGIAISSKMKAQIDALDQAESNAADGESALNIADGALNEVSSMLQRIRELSVQAANGTNSYSDRQSIQAEIDQLTDEVDRISADTEYNEKTLLDGSSNVRVYSKQAERLDVSANVLPDTYSLTVEKAATQGSYTLNITGDAPSGTITINDVTVEYTQGMNATDDNSFFEALRDAAEQAGCEAKRNTTTGGYDIVTKGYGSAEELTIGISKSLAEEIGFDTEGAKTALQKSQELAAKNGTEVDASADDSTYSLTCAGTDATVKKAGGFSETATVSVDGTRIKVTDVGGFSMDFMLKTDSNKNDTEVNIEVTDIGAMTIQLGANQYQEMDVRIPEVSAKSLYLDTVDVTTTNGADKAMRTLDDAIAKVNEVRSSIGAYTNRLEYATSSLAETQEDMTSAYSNLMDTDMAAEMTEYTQQTVLEQASISVLSQANDLPQQVLSLLQ
jgi:flagellin